jgi:hypothetical protein
MKNQRKNYKNSKLSKFLGLVTIIFSTMISGGGVLLLHNNEKAPVTSQTIQTNNFIDQDDVYIY